MEKNQSSIGLISLEKNPKNHPKCNFSETSVFSGGFWDFSNEIHRLVMDCHGESDYMIVGEDDDDHESFKDDEDSSNDNDEDDDDW